MSKTAKIFYSDYRVTIEGEGLLQRFSSENPQHVDHWVRYQLSLLRQFGYAIESQFVADVGVSND